MSLLGEAFLLAPAIGRLWSMGYETQAAPSAATERTASQSLTQLASHPGRQAGRQLLLRERAQDGAFNDH